MQIETIVVGPFAVNCYVLWEEEGRAVVIDPGEESDVISGFLKERELEVSAYLLTHGHMDHISALAELHRVLPAPVRMHAADIEWAFTELNQVLPHYPVPQKPDCALEPLEDGEQLALLSGVEIIHTPGHTPGGVCIHFPEENVLFSGDTLFRGSVGRTDFSGGDARQLTESLQRLKRLPAETTVYPGHNSATTLKREMESNIFLR